ncbi:MAG: peptidase S8 and S53 subtilisin kexin sedolisin [Saprospiraceae bacterium]|nr:MAG: peptidase S8 and S53 subtilisin kexin sedolisin [Saprospiraceae bacterium]
MGQFKIKSGKGEIILRKSDSLVGLKATGKFSLANMKYISEEHLPNLGGFKVVALEKDGGTVDDKLDEVRQKRGVALGTHVYFAEGSQKPMVPTGEIIITFEPGVDEEEQKLVLDEYHLELAERRRPDQIIAKVTKESPNPIKVAGLLQKVSLVKVAEPDMDMLLDEYEITLPKDALFSQEWHLQNQGFIPGANYATLKGADAKIVDAWQRIGNLGSSQVVLAVIDNGIDIAHPDLKDKVYRPYDLWTQSDRITDGDPTFTHGTPVSSLAVAAANGQGMVGVAPNAKFMPVNGTSFSARATEQMFEYCASNGADIISCSWGTTDARYALNSLKEEAIAKAASQGRKGKGCIILFAAGNEGFDYVNFYAAHPDVICVGACDSKDRYAGYSNQGREVSVVAPSNGDWPLLAARAWWDPGTTERGGGAFKYWADGLDRPGPYKHFGGTSGSTPIVAGICALMLSAHPGLTAKEVKDILQTTADKIGSPSEYTNGHSPKYGYGRVNAGKAVADAFRRRDAAAGLAAVPEDVLAAITSGQGLFLFDVKRQPAEGWGVQMGVFADYGNVLINAEKLQRQFGEAIVVNINELNGKTVYKVILGSFAQKRDAEKLQLRMKDAGLNGFLRDLRDLA